MRGIFQAPQELTQQATHFQWLMYMNQGRLTEQDIADSLRITTRQVREIASRFNFRQWLNCDNSVKYTVIDKKYHIITKDSDKRDYVMNKRLFNVIKELKAYKIYLEDIGGDTNQLQMSLDEFVSNYKLIKQK